MGCSPRVELREVVQKFVQAVPFFLSKGITLTLRRLDGDEVRNVHYTDTEHFRLTKQFLIAPERYFKHLFSDDPDEEETSRASIDSIVRVA